MVEGLLEVEKGAGSMSCACGAEGGYPDVGRVEVSKKIGGVAGVNGGERDCRSETAPLEPVVRVGPRGGEGGEMGDLQLDERMREVHAPKIPRELSLSEHVVGEGGQA